MPDLYLLDEIYPGSDAPFVKALRGMRGQSVDLFANSTTSTGPRSMVMRSVQLPTGRIGTTLLTMTAPNSGSERRRRDKHPDNRPRRHRNRA